MDDESAVKRVLIVDDDEQVRSLLSTVLRKDGIQTFEADCAEEALGILKRCKDQNISVLIIDLSLPGMDGASLCRRMRRTEPLKVTIAMTGYTDLFTICECREAGFDDYFGKPISVPVVRAAMLSAFKRARYWETIARSSYLERSKKKTPNGSGIL